MIASPQNSSSIEETMRGSVNSRPNTALRMTSSVRRARFLFVIGWLVIAPFSMATSPGKNDFAAGATAYRDKDYARAMQIFLPLAQQGHPDAQTLVGLMYEKGLGVPKDVVEAAKWNRRGAEQGNPGAQLGLGMMYVEGVGVPRDYQQAYFWLMLANAQGKSTPTLLSYLEQEISPVDRANAQAAARKWVARAEQPVGPSESAPQASGAAERQSKKPASTGSGFRIASDSVITNHHVVESCNTIRVNGEPSRLHGSDPNSDLALLKTMQPGLAVDMRNHRVRLGEPVTVAGYPLPTLLSGLSITTGNISSLSGPKGDTRLIQISAPVQPGNSGGPILDASGSLIGVVVSKLDAIRVAERTGDIPQNVNFGINANVLRAFLDSHATDYQTTSSDKPMSQAAIAEKAKTFTVLIECVK